MIQQVWIFNMAKCQDKFEVLSHFVLARSKWSF
jgi:hypothetical protein